MEAGRVKAPDVNDLAQSGQLPTDPRRAAEPVTPAAKARAEDEARLHIDRDLMREAYERITTVKTDSRLITTGHYQVDFDTGGFEKEFIWIVGADTSWGKSSYAIMVLDENLKRGFRPLVVTWEDAPKLFGSRILARRAQVDAQNIKAHHRGYGRLSHAELDRLMHEARVAGEMPIILDARGLSVEKLTKRVESIVRSEGVDIVMVDYLQAGDNDRKQQDRRNSVTYIARCLGDATKKSGAAGLFFSQVAVKEGQKHPDRHSLKESRDLANMAEVVALGFLTEQDIRTKDSGRLIAAANSKVLFVDKVKDGPPKKIHGLTWNERVACFDVTLDPDAAACRQFDDHFGTMEYPGMN